MTDNIQLGLELMGIGMSIVFLFLLLLIFNISILSFCVQRYQPEEEAEESSPKKPRPEIDSNIAAAITIAVNRYQTK